MSDHKDGYGSTLDPATISRSTVVPSGTGPAITADGNINPYLARSRKATDFHLLGTDLFGEEIKADTTGKLRELFEFPPFTILNAREGPWQERKRAWLACGIQSEVGRGENLLKMSDTLLEPDPEKRAAMQAARGDAVTFGSGGPGDLAAGFKARAYNDHEWQKRVLGHVQAPKTESASLDGLGIGTTTDPYRRPGEEVEGAGSTGTSIFDPVLCELMYRWFCPPNGMIVDPFAGGSVRGVVAGLLGFRYHGIDLRPEQIAANEVQRQQICPDADITWHTGDSNVLLKDAPEADFIFSCPPYGDLEQYSDDPDDLSALTWEKFVGLYRAIIRKSVERLKPNRFACFVVGEYRDKETGLYRGFVPLTCASFMAAGAALYNEAILITAVGSLPIRVTKQFDTSRKLGKALRNGSMVLSPKGWKPIETLKEGDQVIAVDGCPTTVTGVFPQGTRSLWEVNFTDRTSLVADSDHQWALDNGVNIDVLTTAEIITKYGQQPKVKPQLPSCAPVQFPTQAVPLDPYLLGVLLGDGGLNQNTPVFSTVDQEIVDGLMFPAGVTSRSLPNSYDFIFAGVGSRSLRNPLTVILRQLGVMKKKAHQKFVPDLYLWNDVETRLAVLRGLMDTDGGVSGRNTTTEFSSVSLQLANDVAFLARSLGAKVVVAPRKPTIYRYLGEVRYGQPSYRVRISGGLCPFKLRRKADVWKEANEKRSKGLRKSIVSIQPTTDGLATCISVEHPTGLFVVENFTVTHNTHQNVILCVKGDPKLAAEAIRGQAAPEAVKRHPRPEPVAPSLSVGPSTGGSLAEFLGTTVRTTPNWVAQEPPQLDGIKEVVLNFATDGLDWAHGNRPVGVTVSTLDGQLARFLPFRFNGGNLDEAAIKRWAERELRDKKIYNAHTAFDMHMSREWGVDLEAQGCTFTDIQHTAALLDDHRKQFKLDVLAADYLPGLQAVGRVDESSHANYHASEVASRELHTAGLVWQLRDVMYPELDKQELCEIQALEDDVIPAVVEMERNGAPIDLELLDEFHRECHAAHDALILEISHEVGFAFEHTASGWKRLLEHLGFHGLDSYAEDKLNKVDHPLIRKGQLASQHASLCSKVFDPYKKNVGSDGILRFSINQLRGDEGGTVSGRFSIEYVQQVPNKDNHAAIFGDKWFPRRLYIPGSKDVEYLEADAAQIEFRLFAHYANNKALLDAYAKDPWLSFHKITWEMIKAYKPDMLYSHQKGFNFAGQYGARSIKLAVIMGFITVEEGDEIRRAKNWDDPRLNLIHEIEAAYKKIVPEREGLLDRAAHLAKSKCDEYCKKGDKLHREFQHRGYVRTLRGRRSRFPTNYKPYIGLNRVLQGTGADIMKIKLAALHRERKHTGLILRLTNHDAALGDATDPETLTRVREILNTQCYPELKVPVLWNISSGRSWADAK